MVLSTSTSSIPKQCPILVSSTLRTGSPVCSQYLHPYRGPHVMLTAWAGWAGVQVHLPPRSFQSQKFTIQRRRRTQWPLRELKFNPSRTRQRKQAVCQINFFFLVTCIVFYPNCCGRLQPQPKTANSCKFLQQCSGSFKGDSKAFWWTREATCSDFSSVTR